MRKLQWSVPALVILIPSLLAQGQEVPNWPAPLYWSFGGSANARPGERASAISGQLPLVAVTPCRVMDTRPEYTGFPGPFGAPVFGAGQQREVPVPQSNRGIPASARAYAASR